MYACMYGMHYVKNRGNKEIPLVLLSRILAQSCILNPLPELCREGLRMIVLVCLIIIDSIAMGIFFVSMIFRMVHPYIHIHPLTAL